MVARRALPLPLDRARPRACASIETLSARILDRERPDEVEADGPRRGGGALLLARACSRAGVLFHEPPAGCAAASEATALLAQPPEHARRRVLTAAQGARWCRPHAAAGRDARAVLFLSHAAFWKRARRPRDAASREQYEHYFDRI